MQNYAIIVEGNSKCFQKDEKRLKIVWRSLIARNTELSADLEVPSVDNDDLKD